MREVAKEVIDGNTYEFYPMPVMKGVGVLTRLLKLLGAPLGQFISSFGKLDGGFKEALNGKIDFDALGTAIGELFERFDEATVQKTIQELLSDVKVDGKELVIEFHFHGRIGTLMKVVTRSLRVNFQDFFSANSAFVAKLQSQITKPANPQ